MLKKTKSERLIWIDVTITLLVLCAMAYFSYGIRFIVLAGICVAVSLAAELLSLRLMHRKFTADDLSCTSDALITALMMPAVIQYRIPAIACVFVVIAAKNIFGGRRNMIFSPSAVAYIFILTSWRHELLSYPEPHVKTEIFEKADQLVNSASYTFNHTGTMHYSDFEILMGNFSGPAGAVSILLLIVSAVMLLFRKDISFGAFAGTIIGTAFMAYFCPVSGSGFDSVKYVMSTNMILFAAIYIVSDRRIAPKKNYYAFFYGFFISISSYVVMLTSGKENVIVIMAVIFTPLSLLFKNLQNKIDTAAAQEQAVCVNNETVSEVQETAEVDSGEEEKAEVQSTAENNPSEETTDDETEDQTSDSQKDITASDEDNNPEGDEGVE